MAPDEGADYLLHLRERNLARAKDVKARGGEHVSSITMARWMRWHFDPEFVQRSALMELIENTPGGLGWAVQTLPLRDNALRSLPAGLQEAVILMLETGQPRPPSPSPEVTAFLDTAPDPLEDAIQHGREAIRGLQLRPSCPRSERPPLLRWIATIDTLTVHYLSKSGGGQLTREDACAACDLDDRTFRYRLGKLCKWGLIGSARKPPVKLPVARN